MKPVIPRERANRDVDDAVDSYLKAGAAQAALGLVDALEDAYALLGRYPGIGTYKHTSWTSLAFAAGRYGASLT